MNSSTSALGRALGFLGFGITKSIASQDEVKARQEYTEKVKASNNPDSFGTATPKQIGFLKSLARGKAWDDFQLLEFIHKVLGVDDVVVETLSAGQCSKIIEAIKA